jgi:hypothetical protein
MTRSRGKSSRNKRRARGGGVKGRREEEGGWGVRTMRSGTTKAAAAIAMSISSTITGLNTHGGGTTCEDSKENKQGLETWLGNSRAEALQLG